MRARVTIANVPFVLDVRQSSFAKTYTIPSIPELGVEFPKTVPRVVKRPD